MGSLPELQQAFGAALVDARSARNALPLFRGASQLVQARLAIYRGNVHANAGKALAAAYPVVRKIVGPEFFDAMARRYLAMHPSASGDLNRFGAALPAFLESFPQTQDLPYLGDVARMEGLAHRACYAADAAPFDPSCLATVPAERHPALRLSLAPACGLLASRWPLGRIWEAHQDDHAVPPEVDLAAGPDFVLVDRPAWRARVQSIPPGDFKFLELCSYGEPLGEALLGAAHADPSFDPSRALAGWIQAGVIASIAERKEPE